MASDARESFSAWDDAEPYEFYERVRATGEVVWDEGIGAWLVVSTRIAREVLGDDDLYTHPYLSMSAGDSYLKIRSGNTRSMMFLRGEKHRAMHRWWVRELLAPRIVAGYRREVVAPVVAELIERLAIRGHGDLVADYAERIPVGVFARLLGLPRTDDPYLDELKTLNDDIAAFAGLANSLRLETDEADPDAVAVSERAVAAGEELNAILLPVVRGRSDGAGEDFISRLWAGGVEIFEDWNELDVLDACRRLLFAGIDTTTHAIANAFQMLLSDDGLLARVRHGDADVTAAFVEEVLRLNGSVQFRPRRAERDVTLAGASIKAGEMLLVLLIAASRDGTHHACPQAVELERPVPRDHLAFSYGPRACPGAALARIELVEAVAQALAGLPTLQLEETAPPASFGGILMRSWGPLYVRCARAPARIG